MENNKIIEIEKLRRSYEALAKVEAKKYGLTKDLVILSNAYYENNVLNNKIFNDSEAATIERENLNNSSLELIITKLPQYTGLDGIKSYIIENSFNITLRGYIKGESFEHTIEERNNVLIDRIYYNLKKVKSTSRIIQDGKNNGNIIDKIDANKIFEKYRGSTINRNLELVNLSKELVNEENRKKLKI